MVKNGGVNKKHKPSHPYAFAGEAYLQLGQNKKALEMLEIAEKRIAGNPDYEPIEKPIREILKAMGGR